MRILLSQRKQGYEVISAMIYICPCCHSELYGFTQEKRGYRGKFLVVADADYSAQTDRCPVCAAELKKSAGYYLEQEPEALLTSLDAVDALFMRLHGERQRKLDTHYAQRILEMKRSSADAAFDCPATTDLIALYRQLDDLNAKLARMIHEPLYHLRLEMDKLRSDAEIFSNMLDKTKAEKPVFVELLRPEKPEEPELRKVGILDFSGAKRYNETVSRRYAAELRDYEDMLVMYEAKRQTQQEILAEYDRRLSGVEAKYITASQALSEAQAKWNAMEADALKRAEPLKQEIQRLEERIHAQERLLRGA